MPYGRSYRKKARKIVRKAKKGKRLAKKIGKKIIGKSIPGYNVYSTADDVYWLGSKAYRFLKNRQSTETNRNKDRMGSNNSESMRGGRRKRYGIDDYY